MSEIAKLKKTLSEHEKRISSLEKKIGKNTVKKIKSSGTTSVLGLIMELKDEGFFSKPKQFSDIQDELSRKGFHYNKTSLSKPILTATRKKIIGRIGTKRHWKYVSR